MPVYDNGGDVKAQPSFEERIALANPVQLPKGYEDAKPVYDKIVLPKGYEDAQPVARYGEAEAVANRPAVAKPTVGMKPMPLYDNGGDVKVPEDHKMTVKAEPLKPEDYLSRYGSEAAVANRPEASKPTTEMKPMPLYDDGGDVDVNDGKHQVAVLQDGERVLTPEEAEQYKKEKGAPVGFPGPVLPNPKGIQPESDSEHKPENKPYPGGARMNIDNATIGEGDQDAKTFPTVMPTEATAKTPLKPHSEVLEEQAKTKAAEMVQNPNPEGQPSTANVEGKIPEGMEKPEEKSKPTLGQGLAQDWLKKIGANVAQPTTSESTETQVQPREVAPAQPAGLKPIVQPETAAAPTAEAKPMDLKAALHHYDQQIQAALDEATPEGQEKALRLNEAKQELIHRTPWGSAENHPGVLGKLGHVAAQVGSRLPMIGQVVNQIPGSEGARNAEHNATLGELDKATQLTTAREAEENKADKGAGDAWKLNANVVGPNGRAVLENAKTGETKEAPEGYTAYDKPEHQGDQATYIAQWYKDHPDAPKSTANDDKAIESYGSAKAAAAQENKAKGKIYYYDTPDGRQAYTYGEAKAAGKNPDEDGYPVSAQQAEKDRKSNDTYIALKDQMGQYKQNIAKSVGQLLPTDVEKMASVVESVESPDYVSKIVGGLWDDVSAKPLTGYNEKVMKGALTKSAYDAMSPAARQLVADYFTTLLAHFGNVKATLGQVPRNEKLITTEMNMIPKPYLNAKEAEPAFNNYAAQVERNNAHNVKFGNAQANAPAAESKPAEQAQGFQMTGEEKQLASSITLPDGSHPAAVHKDPVNGKVLVFSGKAGDPWVDATTGKPVK
jgi:hypothetical protein